jgi:cadmium resistance protein CadD (predicted permease)
MKEKIKSFYDGLFFLRERDAEENKDGPSWKFRRKLIYGGYRLGFAMVVFGMFTFFYDTQVSVQMVVGGVSLISIILGAYTATATWEDINLNKTKNHNSGDFDAYN